MKQPDISREDNGYKKQIKVFFDNFADTWDSRFGNNKAAAYFLNKRLRMITKLLGEDYLNLLEAGCGTGYHIMLILKKGRKGLGFDFSEKMIQTADRMKKERFCDLDLEFKVADGESLDLPADAFDRIIFVGYLAHLDNPQAGLNELYRVLRPRGKIVGLVSNRWSPWISLGLRKYFTNDFGVIPGNKEFSHRKIRKMLEEAGFKKIKLVFFNSLPGRLPDSLYYPARILNLIFSFWPICLFGFHIAVIAEK